jgi:chromosome segregation ATPase
MDTDDTGGEKQLELSDIMSILDQGKSKPAAAKKAETPKSQEKPTAPSRDNTFAAKLLSDIEQKNAEILKLNSENMSLKYELKEKDLEIKRLSVDLEEANKIIEDLSRKMDEANAKLGEMDADRAKLKVKTTAMAPEEEVPPEEDVASIFKRLTKSERFEKNDADNVNPDKPQAPRKTAKLYDL